MKKAVIALTTIVALTLSLTAFRVDGVPIARGAETLYPEVLPDAEPESGTQDGEPFGAVTIPGGIEEMLQRENIGDFRYYYLLLNMEILKS